MTAPGIKEIKGAVYPEVTHQTSEPFGSRSHKEDSNDTGRRYH